MKSRDADRPGFFIEAVDPATDCAVMDVRFDAESLAELLDLLPADAAEHARRGLIFYVETDVAKGIAARFNLGFDLDGLDMRIRPADETDDLPYRAHTNRELALMLEGRKPLAVFTSRHPPTPEHEDFPQEPLFEPHVAAGRFIKRERVFPAYRGIPARRTVLYALPEHVWRIDAYLLLLEAALKAGWSEGFERMQGSLLGYEDWQNDVFIDRFYRRRSAS